MFLINDTVECHNNLNVTIAPRDGILAVEARERLGLPVGISATFRVYVVVIKNRAACQLWREALEARSDANLPFINDKELSAMFRDGLFSIIRATGGRWETQWLASPEVIVLWRKSYADQCRR